MINIYMKPTNYCNVDCEHCYLPVDTRADRTKMTMDTVKKTAELALRLAEKENHDGIHFVWHGGEPLMLPPDYYYEAGEAIETVIGRDYFTESLQTSLIPYTSKWAPLVKDRYASSIGSSVDFTQRHIKGSNDDYVTFFLKRVQQAREDGLYITPGMVPTRHELGKGSRIVDWAIQNEFIELNIERYTNFGSTPTIDRPTNMQHSKFLIEVFDEVLKALLKDGRAPHINVVTGAILGIEFGISSDRWGTRCQREFIVVEPNGSLNTCPDRAMHEKPYSNAHDGADAFRASSGRKQWIRIMDITHKKDHCFTCENNTWCKSGCPITPNGTTDGEDECSGFKTYIDHIRNKMEDPLIHNILLEYAKPLGDMVEANKDIRELFNE